LLIVAEVGPFANILVGPAVSGLIVVPARLAKSLNICTLSGPTPSAPPSLSTPAPTIEPTSPGRPARPITPSARPVPAPLAISVGLNDQSLAFGASSMKPGGSPS